MKKFLFAVSVALLSVPLIHVYQRSVSVVSLCCWLGAILISVIAWYQKENHTRHGTSTDYLLLYTLSVIGLILLYLFNLIPAHFHQDEFIAAYTSMTLPSIWNIDWFASIPPDWVSQFPILFHILQKPFLMILGPTITAIRISTWPYYIVSIIYLYVLTNVISNKFTARIAIIVYILLAPNLYLSSMGLHFISSTALYLAAITEFLLSVKEKGRLHAVVSGIWCGLSFLTYTSSYLAFPIVLLIGLIHLAKNRSKKALSNLVAATWMTGIIVFPFFLYAFHVHNFFLERIDQIQTISGSWSKTPELVARGHSLMSILTNQVTTAVRSLFTAGVGGHGGYNFGKLALFDPFTALLVACGLLLFFFSFIRKKNIYVFALLVVIFVPFVSGFLLTIPPPAFHRLAVIFPLLSICIAIVFSKISDRIPNIFGKLLVVLLLFVYAITNIHHAYGMTTKDSKENLPGSIAVSAYLNANVTPGNIVYIAAFPSYHLVKELFFRTQNAYRFITKPLLEFFPFYRGESVVILYAKPEDIQLLSSKYPQYYQYADSYKDFPLNELTIFSTKQ